MADDWRATVTCVSKTVKDVLSEIADQVHNRLGDRVAVSSDKGSIFLYAGSFEVAREAGQIAQDVLSRHEMSAELVVHFWDAIEDTWMDAAEHTPPGADEVRAYLSEQERLRSQEAGVPLWQVRVQLRSRRDAAALAGQLTSAGTPVVRHGKVLAAGADSEEDALELAETIRGYAPQSAAIHAEHRGGLGSTVQAAATWMP